MGRNDEPFLEFSDFRDPFGIQLISADVKSPKSDPRAHVNNISTGELGGTGRVVKEIFKSLPNYAKRAPMGRAASVWGEENIITTR